jgi:hypothetical protein
MWNIFSYLGSITTNEARCLREIKSRITTAKAVFYKKKNHFTSKLDLNLIKKLVK